MCRAGVLSRGSGPLLLCAMVERGGWIRRLRLLVLALLTAAMLVTTGATASAQGWMYHPNSGNYWYCDYYGSEFWCYAAEMGLWVRAASPAMMQQDGWQPV